VPGGSWLMMPPFPGVPRTTALPASAVGRRGSHHGPVPTMRLITADGIIPGG
jgi:hypothetical protein